MCVFVWVSTSGNSPKSITTLYRVIADKRTLEEVKYSEVKITDRTIKGHDIPDNEVTNKLLNQPLTMAHGPCLSITYSMMGGRVEEEA